MSKYTREQFDDENTIKQGEFRDPSTDGSQVKNQARIPPKTRQTGYILLIPGTGEITHYLPDDSGKEPPLRCPTPPAGGDVEAAYAPSSDQTQQQNARLDFCNESIRKGFLRKVYGILLMQLIFTFSFTFAGCYVNAIKCFIQKYIAFVIVASVLQIVLIVTLACVPKLRRRTPWNYIFLFLITSSQTYLMTCVSSMSDSQYLLIAAGLTMIMTLALTLFAFQTWVDFTILTGCLFSMSVVLLLFTTMMIALTNEFRSMQTLYICLGIMLFSIYIVYDTQIMMTGEHKYQISPEEYIFAALNLYLDIMNLFLYLLRLFSRGD